MNPESSKLDPVPADKPIDPKALAKQLQDGLITEQEYVSKMAEAFECADGEAFACDHCGVEVDTDSIALCATCNYHFGFCEACFEAKTHHEHPLQLMENLWSPKFDLDLIEKPDGTCYFYTLDMSTLINLSRHCLTTELKIALHPAGKEKGFQITFLNDALADGIQSDLIDETPMMCNFISAMPQGLKITKTTDCAFLDTAWKNEH